MSQSQFAKKKLMRSLPRKMHSQSQGKNSYGTFSKQDFLFAVLAHVLIICIIVVVAWWDSAHTPPPPMKHIEVSMISAQALKKMQYASKTKQHKTIKKVRKKKPEKIKAIKPKRTHKNHKKPVTKFTEKHKTIRKSTHKKVQKEPDFDPFAPIESSSNKPRKTHTKAKTNITQLMDKQLSTQEIDQYIAMMQAAVQRHWKVPGGIHENTPDPVVEMVLQRNGRLLSVKIIESSGNRILDQTLITAIRAAAPFQIPSDQFESFRINRIRFHPL